MPKNIPQLFESLFTFISTGIFFIRERGGGVRIRQLKFIFHAPHTLCCTPCNMIQRLKVLQIKSYKTML